MHVFSTNIVLWLRTLVKETIDALEEAEENMKGGHLEGKLKLVGGSNPALISFHDNVIFINWPVQLKYFKVS